MPPRDRSRSGTCPMGPSRDRGGSARSGGPRQLVMNSIWVSGSALHTFSRARLMAWFENKCGPVLSIDIPAHKSYLFVRFHSVESYERGLALDGAHLDDIRLYIRTSTRTGPQSRRSSRDYPRSPTSAPRHSHARSDTPEEERPFSPTAPELHAWHDHAKVSPSERAMSLEALDYGFDVAQRTGTECLLPEREVAVTSASEEKFRSEGRVERWREETVKSRGDDRHATRRASRSRSRERDGTRGSGRERDRSTTQEDLAYRGTRNSDRRGNSLFDTRPKQSLPPASGSRTPIFQDRDVQSSRRRSLSPASTIVDLERDTRGTPAPRIILPLPSSAAAVHDENRPVSSVRDPASSRALSRTQTASSLANIVDLGLQLPGEGVSSSSDVVEPNQFICEASRLVVRNLSPLCSPEGLRSLASQCGVVRAAAAHRYFASEGMIEFATSAEAERALSTLNGTLVNGASIRLQRGFFRPLRFVLMLLRF